MAEAYRAHRRILLARARRVLRDPDLAEEAVQEAFLRAWRACGSFDPAGPPVRSWLLAITGHVAIDLLRARVRQPVLSLEPTDMVGEPGLIGDHDLVLLRHLLSEGLAKLSAPQAQALVETYLLDRPAREAAHNLGVPVATVRTRVHYGLRRLRTELDAMDAAA